MQYYLQYEVYKSNYDAFVTCTNDTTPAGYEGVWNSYESNLNSYRIPPLVTWSDGTGTSFD